MFDARHARQHLFGRPHYQRLDVFRRRTRKRHKDIRQGDIDLRLFFTRRDQRGKDAQQDRQQRN